jgi:hypothetical protein
MIARMQNKNGCLPRWEIPQLANDGHAQNNKDGFRIRPYVLSGSSPPSRQSAVNSLISEAVALAPPCTHAVQCFHTFVLNTLIEIILPKEAHLVTGY